MRNIENGINLNKISHGFMIKYLTQNEVKRLLFEHKKKMNNIFNKYLFFKCPKNIIILKELSRIIDLIISFKELQVIQYIFLNFKKHINYK